MMKPLDASSPPQLGPGNSGDIGGLEWRIMEGAKPAPNGGRDMVLEVRSARWNRVKLAVACLFADFHYQVEDILFPRPRQRGGEYALAAMAQSCRELGWVAVATRIEMERGGGMRPDPYRYENSAPFAGFEDEGRRVGRLRTSVMAALWAEGTTDSSQILDALQEVIETYAAEAVHA